jgi:ferric-dicitrate binding protein FerR (iron transport regulator)
MEKYKNYSTEDFLADDFFIQWLKDPDEEHEKFWNEYIKRFPEQAGSIEQAKFIVSMFQHKHEKLSLDETYDIWNGAIRNARKPRTKKILRFVRYAAILLLMFASGALAFYFYENSRTVHYDLTEISKPVNNEAKIILADGSEISLEKKDSEITYNSSGNQLIVNNDTINQNQLADRESMNKVIIPYGKKSMIVLSDGTKVWLNAGSQLVYPSMFLRKRREVVLVGEAYFEVAKNKDKPFIVRTSDLNVKVLGTKFDVSAYPEDKIIETILVEGSVSLEVGGKGAVGHDREFLLSPNQKISLNKESRETNVRIVDVSMYTAWKDGMVKTESEDLVRLIKKIERYYNIQVALKDPLVGGYKISGKLDLEQGPEEVLNIIKLTVPIDWTKKSNGDFIIMKK